MMIFIIGVIAMIYNTFIAVFLWDWFMAEPFGLPQISIPHMMGISLFVGMFKAHKSDGHRRR